MSVDELSAVLDGLYFDELAKLRALDAETLSETTQLKDESKAFQERLRI